MRLFHLTGGRMSRTRGALSVLALAVGSIAFGQVPPPTTESPVTAPGGLSPPSQEPATPTPAKDQQPAAPAETPKTAETLEKLTKTVDALSKNLTVTTADEQIKVVFGGLISADFYFNQARPVAPGIPFFLGVPSPFG